MALIKCPDCQTDVSSFAVSCVKCARPILPANIKIGQHKTQTIEKTSKKYKAQLIWSSLLTIIGFCMIYYGATKWGAGCAAIGVLWFFFTRLGAWWEHA